MTTLDWLIGQFGVPAFAKIDVEGSEYQVIQGLSHPVRALSLEFTPEVADSTFHCLERLGRLGSIRVTYSLEESMQLALDEWVGRDEIINRLSAFKDDHRIYGDVYVRFAGY
jgi:hypothetical protein